LLKKELSIDKNSHDARVGLFFTITTIVAAGWLAGEVLATDGGKGESQSRCTNKHFMSEGLYGYGYRE
jgi:hypothetical protein